MSELTEGDLVMTSVLIVFFFFFEKIYHLNMTTTQFVKLNLVGDQVFNASIPSLL